jgi:hypothetical protein
VSRLREGLEARGVEVVGVQHDAVARRLVHDHRRRDPGRTLRFQQPTQVRDVGLHRREGLRRRLRAPQLLDQTVEGDHRARVEQQDRQDGALLRAPEDQRPSRVEDLQRPEDVELHRPPASPAPPGSPSDHPAP